MFENMQAKTDEAIERSKSQNGAADIADGLPEGGDAKPKASSKSAKRLSVERIYQKKTQLEHILLRPDTYIGSVEHVTQVFHCLECLGNKMGSSHEGKIQNQKTNKQINFYNFAEYT